MDYYLHVPVASDCLYTRRLPFVCKLWSLLPCLISEQGSEDNISTYNVEVTGGLREIRNKELHHL
jgi:hypothetical protein